MVEELLLKSIKYLKDNALFHLYPHVNKKSILSACLYKTILDEHSIFITVDSFLQEEEYIGLLGSTDECECLNNLSFMRTHAIIHDAFGRVFTKYKVGRGYCYALKKILLVWENRIEKSLKLI